VAQQWQHTKVARKACSVWESRCAHPTVEPDSVELPQQNTLLLCAYDCASPPTQPLRHAAGPAEGAGGGAHLHAHKHSPRLRAGLTLVGRRLCPVVCGDVGARPQVLAHRRRGSVAHAGQTAPGPGESARSACLLLPRGQPAALLRVCKVQGAVARQVEEVLHPLGALALRCALSLLASTSLSGSPLSVPACPPLATLCRGAAAAWGRP